MRKILTCISLLFFAVALCGAQTTVIGGASVSNTGSSLSLKLSRLADVAWNNNYLTNPPLTAETPWAASTSYALGNIVNNGGNLYFCQTAGTSAASGGPTTTVPGPITDGTVTWYYWGKALVTTNSPVAPTMTTGTTLPTGMTKTYNWTTAPNVFFVSGGIAQVVSTNYLCVKSLSVMSGNYCPSGNSNYYSVSFMTDSPKFAFTTISNPGLPFRVIVDGQYVKLGGTYPAISTPAYTTLDFTLAGGRKTRRITIEMSNNYRFQGVVMPPTDSIWAPDQQDSVRAIFVGDSLFVGANNFPSVNLDMPHQVGAMLGWSDIWNAGQGATGWLYTKNNTRYNYAQRIPTDVCGNSPDIVVVGDTTNDLIYTAVQITSATVTTLQEIRACLPKVPIIVIGTGNSSSLVQTQAADNAVAAGVQQFADSNTYWIPISTDASGPWFTGTGTISSAKGDGNQDVYAYGDGYHFNEAGFNYYAYRIAVGIKKQVLPNLK